MQNFIGVLIRRERLRQNYSQEGLCRGICAVSYLSKIEQGKVSAGEDILLPLLERLGIRYETDPDFLARAGSLVEALYEDLFSGRDELPEFQEKLRRVADQEERYLASPYLLDILLLPSYAHSASPLSRPTLDQLAEFVPCMTARQYQLYLLLRLLDNLDEKLGEELLRLNPCGFYTTMVGSAYSCHGRYAEATALLSRGYDLAAQEGSVHLMVLAKMYLGNCYCITGQQALMHKSYAVAKKLAAAVNYPGIAQDMDYNIASAYLEWGRTEEAYTLLLSIPGKDELLYYHKLALCLEKLGRQEEARKALERGYADESSVVSGPRYRRLLDLVRYRLDHPDYLHDDAYAALMETTFTLTRKELPDGFARAHLPYLLEVLENRRRYRDAYQLVQEFFINIGSIPD